jgi:hypothetical protein
MKTKLLASFFTLLTITSFSQTGLQVVYATNLDSLVAYFIENGVTFSNVTKTGNYKALGSFSGGIESGLGMENGILLASGDIAKAKGPNNSSNAGTNFSGAGDAHLSAHLAQSTYDASVLEFDLVPEGNVLAFNYVFGSEEYPEYVGMVNDGFAYFISGPDPDGGYYDYQNIALIPGTNTMVAINTVNPQTNSQYYINNTGQFLQYDGYTVTMPIEVYVVPNQTYHLKIVIADSFDHIYDSGVFLQSPSLKSFKKDYTEPFAQAGAEWHYTFLTDNPAQVVFKTISHVSDTLIDEKLCSKMLEQDYQQSAGSIKHHYMYRVNDSVFFFEDGEFRLLYGFGAEAGDTIQLGYSTASGDPLQMIIDSTGTIMVGGEPRKLQYITCGDGLFIEFGKHVIEGIGSTSFMFPTVDMSHDGPLRCYSDNSTPLFINTLTWNGQDCGELILSTNEQALSHINIYPNPANDIIKINGLNNEASYRIITTGGTVIMEGRVNNTGIININSLKSGMYFLEIKGKDLSVTRRLFKK